MLIPSGGFSRISCSLALIRFISFKSFIITACFLAALNSSNRESIFSSNSSRCATQRS